MPVTSLSTTMLASGTTMSVWGSNVAIGNSVLIRDNSIIGKIAKESVTSVTVP